MIHLALAVLLFVQEGQTRDVLYREDARIDVYPPVSSEDRHVTCVVLFPEDSIESLVAAWKETDLSLERRNNALFLKLLKPVEGDLHVLGSSGTLYRLAIRPGTDTAVRIRRPQAPRPERERRLAPSLEFIRAMRMGWVPPETSVRRAGKGDAFRLGPLHARCRTVYENDAYSGFVVELRNTESVPYRIDPSRFRAKALIVVGLRAHVVPPQGNTLLYLVFGRGHE
ncbi:MAG: type-F conjugative transfer system secretin TraK [Planctomycetes bacterium]|nr:type-F conjugative transfer system secretin TraK [Planctomycetota bacterium]